MKTIAIAVLTALFASLVPSAPSVAVAAASYPIDRGVVRLTDASGDLSVPTALQDTNEVYSSNNEAHNVVASPASWNSDQQRWNLQQTGADTYRFVNAASGRALQSTNEVSGAREGAYNLVTSPASWNSAFQEFRVTSNGATVEIWGTTPAGEKQVGVSSTGYSGVPGVYWATMSAGRWSVSGYAFSSSDVPSPTPAPAPDVREISSKWVDNADTGRLTFTGRWGHEASASWAEGNHEGSESFSDVTGARVTTQVSGTGFDIVGPRGANGGQFRVTVDCDVQYVGSSYAPTKQFRQSLLTVDNLPRGEHTVVVEVLGTRDQGSLGDYVMVDGVTSRDSGVEVDTAVRWAGTAGRVAPVEAVTLRRQGCGSQSDLVEVLKKHVVGGWFGVPGAGRVWGGVNGHSAVVSGAVTRGPVIFDNEVYGAATIPLAAGKTVKMRVDVPDRPRTLQVTVAADPQLAEPAQFAVVNENGDPFPAIVMTGEPGSRAVTRTNEFVTLSPGVITNVVVNLSNAQGQGKHVTVSLVGVNSGAAPAELVLFEGRTSDLAAEPFARRFDATAPGGTSHRAVPAAMFQGGPVVLSRVIADADVSAWVGDQNSVEGSGGAVVPVAFGSAASGRSLRVGGEVQSEDTMSVRLPDAVWPASSSTVHLRMETAQRCRSLTASVGIDDSTPNRDSASVTLAVYGDGEKLPINHNGTWQYVDSAIGSVYSVADTRSPVYMAAPRADVASQMRDAKLAFVSRAFTADEQSKKAAQALVNAQFDELNSTVDDPSMSLMTYPVGDSLTLGAGTNALYAEQPAFLLGSASAPIGSENSVRSTEITPLDPSKPFPISVTLASPRLMSALQWAARSTHVPVAQIQSPLVKTVDVVISGTPGAVVDVASAGVDCVDKAVASRAFPLWSQIGVRPAFLPMPQNETGDPLDQLVYNPLWWDMVCPAGPSTSVGMAFTAVRTRTSTWQVVNEGIGGLTEGIKVTELSTAQRSACALPGDQRANDFGPFQLAADSPAPPVGDGRYRLMHQDERDPLASQLLLVDGTVEDVAFDWLATSYRTTMDHPVEFAIWAVLAPFDVPGAVIFNPFVMNALPTSVGVVAMTAYLGVGALEGVGASLAGGEVVSSASRPLESTNELLLGSQNQFATETAAGERATLSTPEGSLSVPLKQPVNGRVTADISSHTTSTVVVATDRAVAEMPVVSDHAPWTEDELFAERVKPCTRDISCRPVPDPSELEANPDAEPFNWADPEILPPDMEVESSFATRYPEQAALIRTAQRVPPPGVDLIEHGWPGDSWSSVPWSTPEGETTWQRMVQTAEAWDPEARIVLERAHMGEEVSWPAVVATDTQPGYIFIRLDEEIIKLEGIEGNTNAFLDVVEGVSPHGADLEFALQQNNPNSAFVAMTRDAQILNAPIDAVHRSGGWKMLRINREPLLPDGKPNPAAGGFDIAATTAQVDEAGARDPDLERLADNDQVRHQANIAVLFIDPRSITHIQDVEYVNGQFIKSAPRAFPGYENVQLTPHELAAIPAPEGAEFPIFDWHPAGGPPLYSVAENPELAQVVKAATEDQMIVFRKHGEKWEALTSDVPVTREELLRAGFEPGHFPQTPREVWVPRSTDRYTVDTGPGWTPSPQ